MKAGVLERGSLFKEKAKARAKAKAKAIMKLSLLKAKAIMNLLLQIVMLINQKRKKLAF